MSSPAALGEGSPRTNSNITIRSVSDSEWDIVAWLWQLFRHDLAEIVNALPYRDGRYQAAELDQFPFPGGAGYLAWRPHPKTGESAPIGFALVGGITDQRRTVVGFWVAPVVRREGVGELLALDVLSRDTGPWSISFQHDNLRAAAFWRRIADLWFGKDCWTETRRPVPGRADAPADHTIESN